MLGPAVEKLTKRDADMCRALRAVVLKGRFEIQGEAAVKIGSLFQWLETLDKKIEETIKEEPVTIRKDLKK